MESQNCQIWTGSFRSETFPISGNIRIPLKPLNVWGYKTKAKITFKGLMGLAQNIYDRNMEIELSVEQNMCFKVKIGTVVATLNLKSEPKVTDTTIVGKYSVAGSFYHSVGGFYLKLGEDNYEQGGCSVM